MEKRSLGYWARSNGWGFGAAWACAIVAVTLASASPAQAMDKKVRLMLKTSGYGAAAGAIVGTGAWAMGYGSYRSMLIGTSLGLYAGIALGAYVLITAHEGRDEQRPTPYKARKPVGPNDWDEPTEEEIEQYEKSHERRDSSSIEFSRAAELAFAEPTSGAWSGFHSVQFSQPVVWTPIFAAQF